MRRPSRALLSLLLAGVAAGVAMLLPARQHAEAPMPPAAHETRDVGFPSMLLAGVLMLLGVLGMMGTALWMYPGSVRDQGIALPLPRFPAPALQPSPPADMAAFHARQIRQLDGTYWLDQAAGRVHLPIAQAMKDVAARGIADWPRR